MNPETIQQIANLSQLEVSDMQKTSTAIENIFSLLNELSQIDTNGIQELYFPLDILQLHSQKLRQDILNPTNIEVEKIAPLSEQNFFLVPKVID